MSSRVAASSTLISLFISPKCFFPQISLFILISLIKRYLDTNLDTSKKILDTFWILFGVPLDTWPPLHLATEIFSSSRSSFSKLFRLFPSALVGAYHSSSSLRPDVNKLSFHLNCTAMTAGKCSVCSHGGDVKENQTQKEPTT